jgi:VWFA-related protein
MTLDVVVSDKSGKPLSGLQQADFTLLDNKLPQKITSFRAVGGGAAAADPPVEAILLLDALNASFTSMASERVSIAKFLARNGGQTALPVSTVFLFDNGTTVPAEPSRDGNALIAEMNKTESGLRTIRRSQGVYGAQERLQISLRALQELADREATRPGRKLLVWISPGWPLFSGPDVNLTSETQQWIFDSIVAVSDRLRRARMTLYLVDPLGVAEAGGSRTVYYKEFLKPVKKESQAQPGNVALQVLASQSGGLVLNSSNDMAEEIGKCVADASPFYVLTFDGVPGDGPNEYHSIEVKLGRPGLAARTRAGYYAKP